MKVSRPKNAILDLVVKKDYYDGITSQHCVEETHQNLPLNEITTALRYLGYFNIR